MKRRSKQDSLTRISRRKILAGLVAAPVAFSKGHTRGPCFADENRSADSLDAIVIGAGAIGCNTAWHLRQRGLNVLVLEAQGAPASQSTNGAAGFVSAWSVIHIGAWKKTEWEMQRY